MEADGIQAIETAAFTAWPPAEQIDTDGWSLRYGDGFSRRLNSLSAGPDASPHDLAGRLLDADGWLRARGVEPVVRITSAAPASIDASLDAMGYLREAETIVMTAGLGSGTADYFSPRPSEEWLRAQQSWMGIGEADAWQQVLGRVPQPAAFAEHDLDGSTVCVGLGVVIGRHLGVFEVTTDPERRRHGHASTLVTGLLGWGVRHGAESAFLQVVGTNEPAIRLYRGFGFSEAYRYWYRRPKG